MSTNTDEKSPPKTEEYKPITRQYTEEELEAHRKKLIKKARFMHIGC